MNPFRKPSPLALAAAELEDAQRELLLAHSGAEYAEALVLYNQQRVERLRETVRDLSADREDVNISHSLGN